MEINVINADHRRGEMCKHSNKIKRTNANALSHQYREWEEVREEQTQTNSKALFIGSVNKNKIGLIFNSG